MDNSFIAYCGVDCSACVDFKTVKCLSCRETVWEDGDQCMPVACCEKRGIHFCGQCAVFPCDDIKSFYSESESHEKAYEFMRSVHDKDKQDHDVT